MADEIPEGWKECRLGDIAEVVGGGTPKTDVAEYWNGEIPWITPRDLSSFKGKYISKGERNISEKGLINSSAKILPKGTILLSTRAPVGYLAIAENDITTNQGFRSLVPFNNTDNIFLYYLLKNNVDYLKSQATGTTFGELAGSVLKSLIFPVPPLAEQRAIASVLSSLDDKIDLLHRENKTLEKMAEAIFRQWFIEEADNEWKEVPLSEVFDFKEGPGIRNWQYRDNGIPFINIRLISNGEIDVSKANFISEAEANAKYKHFYLQRKDMVVSTSGTLGKVAIIRNYHLPLLLNTSVIRFRPKDGINYSFMYGYLNSNEFYECLIDSASGSVQLNFGPIHLKQIVMKIPPNEKLEYFRKVVDPIYEKIELNYNQVRTLERLRDTLLPKLMSGKVRVKI